MGGELHLQRVIHGAANGKKHLVSADVGILSTEGRSGVRGAAEQVRREAAIEGVTRIETATGVIKDARTSGDGAVDRGRISAGPASFGGVRCGDGIQCGCGVEKTRVAEMIAVDADQSMKGHVAQVVDTEDGTGPQLRETPTLNSMEYGER